MKLLIVSDVHNQWDKLARAIEIGNAESCSALLFAGDAHSPHIFAELAAFRGDIYVVSGNNDVPHMIFSTALLVYPRITHCGEVMDVVLDGIRIHMNHYPLAAERAVQSGDYELCIHGHTHKARSELVGVTRILNPGEVCGSRFGVPMCARFDTATREVAFNTL